MWRVLLWPTRSSVLLPSSPTALSLLVLSSLDFHCAKILPLKPPHVFFPPSGTLFHKLWYGWFLLIIQTSAQILPPRRSSLTTRPKVACSSPQHHALVLFSHSSRCLILYWWCVLAYCLSCPWKCKLCESRNLVWIVILHPYTRAQTLTKCGMKRYIAGILFSTIKEWGVKP